MYCIAFIYFNPLYGFFSQEQAQSQLQIKYSMHALNFVLINTFAATITVCSSCEIQISTTVKNRNIFECASTLSRGTE
jgi:hypothetical protein